MSFYIQPENQGLIWNAITKTPLFQQWSKTIQDPAITHTWVHQIIQQVYLQNQAKHLTVQELQKLNRETIAYMLQDLKQKTQEISSHTAHNGSLFGQSMSNSFTSFTPLRISNAQRGNNENNQSDQTNVTRRSPMLDAFPKTKAEQASVTRDYILEQKQDEINRDFENRQKEYSGMLKRGPVQEIDFRLATEPDKPIENMEELIRQQRSRREYEIPVMPIPVSNISTTVNPEPEKSAVKKVHWSNEPIEMVDMVEATDLSEIVPAEKQNNTLIQQFREFMMEIREEMRALREEVNIMKTPSHISTTDNITLTTIE